MLPSKKCTACEPTIRSLRVQNADMHSKLTRSRRETQGWKRRAHVLKERIQKYETEKDFNWASVDSDYCDPEELAVSSFGSYLEKLKSNFPILQLLLSVFIPYNHTRKYNSRAVHIKWKQWSDLYKCFISDMFIRARQPKKVRRTSLMLSVYFLLTNLSEPSWRLLERLRVVHAKQTVEKWVKSFTREVAYESSTLFYSFDNCDFRLHVTHPRSDHRSSYLHIITQYILEVADYASVRTDELWSNVDRLDFGHWIQGSAVEARNFANECFNLFALHPVRTPLRYAYEFMRIAIPKADYVVLEPEMDTQTLTYQDVEYMLESFYGKYIAGTTRSFAFVSGDQQVFVKLWKLRRNRPEFYNWVIPLPGEFHWTWHILKGIYATYYTSILLPLSMVLNYSSLDAEANNFHYAEDFLEIVTFAVLDWVKMCMQRHGSLEVTSWLHSLRPNSNAYELVYALMYYFLPYWITRSALKHNHHAKLEDLWRYWLHLFIAAGKTNYTTLTVRFLWILKSMHPEVRRLYNEYRMFSFSGEVGTGVPLDGFNEMINWYIKHMNPTAPSAERIKWTATALNHCLPLHTSIKHMRITKKELERKLVAGTVEDVQRIHNHIRTVLGYSSVALTSKKKYKVAILYPPDTEVEPAPAPSDALEEAYNNIADVYVLHQFNWDDSERVFVVDSDDSDTDDELPENDVLDL